MAGLSAGVTRREYVGTGMEEALRRLMVFANSGEGMLKTLGGINFEEMGKSIKDDCGWTIVKNLSLLDDKGQNYFEDAWDLVRNNKDRKFCIDFNEKYLNGHQEALKKFDTYPGGSTQTVEDIKLLIENCLKGVKDIDNAVSVAVSGANLTHNHSFIQSIAWMRSADS